MPQIKTTHCSFHETLEDLVTTVFGPILPRHAIAEQTITRAEKRLHLRLPAILRQYYKLAGAHHQVSQGLNFVLRPSGLRIHNGGLIFLDDNQGVTFSAILLADVGQDDPPVKQGNPDEDRWYSESLHLSDFLLAHTCWQACGCLPAGAHVKFTRASCARVQSELPWIGVGINRGHHTLGFWGDGVAGAAFPRTNEVYLASDSTEHLAAFQKRFRLVTPL